jgi:hypothetical protein
MVQLNSSGKACGMYSGGLQIKSWPLNQLSWGFHSFHRYHHAHATTLPQLGHDRSPHHLQTTVNQSSSHFKPPSLRTIQQNRIYLHSTYPLHQHWATFHNKKNIFQISKSCMGCKPVIIVSVLFYQGKFILTKTPKLLLIISITEIKYTH